MTETALELAPDLSADEWAEIGERFGQAHRASAWWIGDWINFGEYKWGEKYEEAQRITGLSRSHLRNCAMVAKRFELSARADNLSWSHHLFSLPLPNAEEILARAEAEHWSALDVREKGRREPAPVLEVRTERQRQVAEANKLRLQRAVGACNGLARGLDEIKTEQAIAVASPEELRGWDSSFRDAIAALRKLRARIKEASS